MGGGGSARRRDPAIRAWRHRIAVVRQVQDGVGSRGCDSVGSSHLRTYTIRSYLDIASTASRVLRLGQLTSRHGIARSVTCKRAEESEPCPSVNPRVRAVLLCALLLLSTAGVDAQRTTGDLLGVVRDSSGRSCRGERQRDRPEHPGAQTTITIGERQLPHRQPAAGHLHGDLRAVRVQDVVLRGPARERRRHARAERRARDWPLAESVTVTAETPVVDTTSNEVGTTFDKDWVSNAPSRRFGFYDLLAQAPGSVKGGDGTAAGERRTMSFGSSFDENAFQLDGVNVTDNFFSEGFSEPNPDAIDEVEVLSLGAPAEYGNLMGAVYNIVTKQGTNQFHGDASYFFQSQRPHVEQHEGREVPERQVRRCLRRRSERPLPVDARRLLRGDGAAGRPDCERQALVLRVLRTPEGRVHARRRELQASRQRESTPRRIEFSRKGPGR